MTTSADHPAPTVQAWKPMTQAEAQALPPLPRPALRGWDLEQTVTASPPPVHRENASHTTSDRDPEPGAGFALLKSASPEQLAPFIGQEHPQVIALILSQLDPILAAGILGRLPDLMQADVTYRIATMGQVPPMVLVQIEERLEISLRDILVGNQDLGGPKVAADILNNTGASVEKNVLDRMDAQDAKMAESVRNMMFVFADIAKLSDREIQALMREVDQKDLVLALKGADDELKHKILSNMTEKIRTFITEEMVALGPMRLSVAEEVQLRIVQQVRQLEERGQITVIRGASEDTFV